MFAPSPRSPDVEYRAAYGFTLFDCASLRASLSPASCADNFTQRKCLACKGCPTGAIHAGQEPPPVSHWSDPKVCASCGRGTGRLVARGFCIGCWNRRLEIVRGENRKRQWPRETAGKLRRFVAILKAGDQARLPEQNSVIRIERYAGHLWLKGVFTNEGELRAYAAAIGTSVVDFDFTRIVQEQGH